MKKLSGTILVLLIGVMVMNLYASPKYPLSDHSDGSKFYNQDRSAHVGKGLYDILKWKLFEKAKPWPAFVDDNVKPKIIENFETGEGSVTFINHATTLLQFQQLSIITDPVFSKRVSPLSWIGPKRHRDSGMTLDELPAISIVLISHNHYDHMDLDALAKINAKHHSQFIVPLGNKKYLEKKGIKNVIELDWWQTYTAANGFDITLVPMQHWSSRTPYDRFKALWGGYVIRGSGLKVLFAGDTGYNQHFKQIKQKFGAMDLSLLPIGAYEPRWFMKDEHLNPDDAIQAHQDLGSKQSVAIHFGTFQLTDEGIEDPVIDLTKSLINSNLSSKDFIIPKNGQTIFFSNRDDQNMQ